ncbi:MAG: hypothetical protein IT168_01675 [Bryobacterales bacterium]|nr:hypothetical protein [Bryobacterales bacterium]
MHTVFIASGDSLHGDAAAVHRVLELLGHPPNVYMHDVPKLTPKLAEEIATAKEVVFIHPERQLGEPWVEPAIPTDDPGRSDPLDPAGLLSLARALYQFRGNAYVCHVPGLDFSRDWGMSPYAEKRAHQAAALLKRFLPGSQTSLPVAADAVA